MRTEDYGHTSNNGCSIARSDEAHQRGSPVIGAGSRKT